MLIFSSFPAGSNRHSITLASQDDGQGPFVKDLSDALSQATGVPQSSQKIIFKGKRTVDLSMWLKCIKQPAQTSAQLCRVCPGILGKSLKDMEESLSSYGLKDGSKLMMIGKRVRFYMCDVTDVPMYMQSNSDGRLQTEQSRGGNWTEEAERHWEICRANG